MLVQSLRGAVRSGALSPGHKLPPVRELAWELGITPGTVARAYKLAADEGLVDTGVGRGTFVAGQNPQGFSVPDQLLNTVQPNAIDFRAVRVPDVGQDAVIRAIMGDLSRGGPHDYIDYPNTYTKRPAREATTDWIGPDRLGRITSDDVVMGLGAQNTVIMALQTVLHGANPVILTEQLAYPGVRHAARLLRAQLIGVEMDDEGMRPDRLEEALRRHGGQVLLTSAEVHSPTTNRTTLARKQQIVALARKYNLQIIEDDCHCITRPEEPAYRGICAERAWFISSLTKSVSASLRFGFAVAPKGQAEMARQVAQSTFYGMPQPILDVCAELMRSGEAERIRHQVEQRVAEQVRLAVNRLGQWDVSWRQDVPFVWLKLPQGWRGSSFARACEIEGIRIKAADEFALPDGAAPHAVRLGLNANMKPARYEQALQKLSDMLARPPESVDL
ncbi:PLP-dependent aminotransferase family protein [Roseovarius sp. 2305UL8-3]|uniref:aminotransferase-like domain-containing protein n=1 Tax=Roseovarius conchicola TaxID=3121636 RepID=UPI003527C2C8